MSPDCSCICIIIEYHFYTTLQELDINNSNQEGPFLYGYNKGTITTNNCNFRNFSVNYFLGSLKYAGNVTFSFGVNLNVLSHLVTLPLLSK